MFKQDYIMRLIHEIIRSLLKLVFNIDEDSKEELVITENERGRMYDDLLDLIDRGEINEAENRLLEELNPKDEKDYKKALMFYSYLNDKEVEFLEQHNYTKKEIMDGIKHVSKIYGYGSIAEALLNIE